MWLVVVQKLLPFLSRHGLKLDGLRIPLAIKEAPCAVWMRYGTSDEAVFNQVFIDRQYACAQKILDRRKSSFVIDCGANVGYTSLYFMATNPKLCVMAVEPDVSNYELCKRNLQFFKSRATVLPVAVWGQPTALRIYSRGFGKEWGVRVAPPQPGDSANVDGLSVPQLLERAGRFHVDLLKLDIDGSESALFSAGPELWLDRVKSIVVELHGPECEDIFWRALAGYEYVSSRSGELVLCAHIRKAVR